METTFNDPVHQQIWATVRALNDAWTKGNPGTLTDYFHPQTLALTSTDRLRRDGAGECVAGWKAFAEAAHIHRWQEIDPLIRVYGDAAVVAYYYEISFEMGGQRFEQGGRDMFFFVLENGRWWAVADQFSSYPA